VAIRVLSAGGHAAKDAQAALRDAAALILGRK
jgi:hypothetical protein